MNKGLGKLKEIALLFTFILGHFKKRMNMIKLIVVGLMFNGVKKYSE
jgi:hypothetical protein